MAWPSAEVANCIKIKHYTSCSKTVWLRGSLTNCIWVKCLSPHNTQGKAVSRHILASAHHFITVGTQPTPPGKKFLIPHSYFFLLDLIYYLLIFLISEAAFVYAENHHHGFKNKADWAEKKVSRKCCREQTLWDIASNSCPHPHSCLRMHRTSRTYCCFQGNK